MWTDLGSQGARTPEIDKMGAETGDAGDHRHTHKLIVELETKVHPKVRNHGEGPY